MTTTIEATFGDLLAQHGVTVPDETIAELTVPVISGEPQRQGDVFIDYISPAEPVEGATLLSAQGVAVVQGEATGNTHILQPAGLGVTWKADNPTDDLLLGTLNVPEGSAAYLIHTDEHGCNGIGPGTYRLYGKREQRDMIARVAD